jgi:hypothetical protein
MQEMSLEAIQSLYFTLDLNFNKLFDACQTSAQKDEFRRDYVNARDAFWEARNRAFADNDPLVVSTVQRLVECRDSIDADLENLQNIVKVLNTISAGVSFASRLLALGAI